MDNKMQNINYNKYREWLNERKEKLKGGLGDNKPDAAFDKKQLAIGIEDETGEHTKSKQVGKEIAKDHLSADPDYYKKIKKAGIKEPKKKLSKYWKIRAKRRADRGGRGYPNKVDESWALEQQTKSESINNRINKLFEKELTVGEELSDNIDEYIKKIQEERASMFKMPKSFGKNKKPKGSISVALGPVYGGVAKGYRKKLKKLKKKGMVGVAPGEAFGSIAEAIAPSPEQAVRGNIEIQTFGQLKKIINAIIKKDAASLGGQYALNLFTDLIPYAGAAKSTLELIQAVYKTKDNKKTKTVLDKINVDDQYSQIVDDKVENAFLNHITNIINTKPDDERIPNDFDINRELRVYLADEFDQRSLTPNPNT